ncbi:hypothetical protein KP79_PYT19865 [Mizuhopecten yessoensis]|uniref:Complex 1 LYR protein domain-containing protein n=1 Tax=Mizuhopecten yessoensis TaxID=6573 RepID=A0A210PSK6_MIZYE|nr:hypothetical protein KP79_PYT19865 [Mizuhopecten yessoensis]
MNHQYSKALSLYRALIRKGHTLRLTDKDFYLKRVRKEFEKNRNLADEAQIQKCIEKGEELMKRDNIM